MCKSIYLINGLEEPPNEKEVNLYLVARFPLPPPPANLSLELQSFLKIFFN